MQWKVLKLFFFKFQNDNNNRCQAKVQSHNLQLFASWKKSLKNFVKTFVQKCLTSINNKPSIQHIYNTITTNVVGKYQHVKTTLTV